MGKCAKVRSGFGHKQVTLGILICLTAAFIVGVESDVSEIAKIGSVSGYKKNCKLQTALTICKNPRKSKQISRNFQRQLDQTLVLIKSLLITVDREKNNTCEDLCQGRQNCPKKRDCVKTQQQQCIQINVFSNRKTNFDKLRKAIYGNSKQWNSKFTNSLELKFIPIKYPKGTEWVASVYRPCSTARLFFHEMMPTYDSVIYLDTDIIFLRNVNDLWKKFESFDQNAVIGISPEFLSVAGVLSAGSGREVILNSGVLLMNLTRMRESNWTTRILKVATEFRKKLKYGDQDVLRFNFKRNPKDFFIFDSTWNFAPPYYRRMKAWKEWHDGIGVLHGYALGFTHKCGDCTFHEIFKAFKEIQLSEEFEQKQVIEKLRMAFLQAKKRRRNFGSRNSAFENSVYAAVLGQAKNYTKR